MADEKTEWIAPHLAATCRTLAMIPTADIEAWVNHCGNQLSNFESFGCFVDPTAYTNAKKDGTVSDAANQLEISKGLLAVRKAIDKREAALGRVSPHG